LAKGKIKVLTSVKGKEDGSVVYEYEVGYASTKKILPRKTGTLLL